MKLIDHAKNAATAIAITSYALVLVSVYLTGLTVASIRGKNTRNPIL